MLLRSLLYLLYMLQLVVLSGMVAAYFYTISNPQPPTAQTAPSTPLVVEPSPGKERQHSLNIKSAVIMKPMSLAYLKENLPKMASPRDLVKLFKDPDVNDFHPNRWISRSLRSTTHTRSHEPDVKRGRRKGKGAATKLHEKSGSGEVKVKSFRDDSLSEDDDRMSEIDVINDVVEDIDNNDGEEEEDLIDYPQDEFSEEDLEAFEAALHHMEEMSSCPSSKCQQPTPYVLNVRDPRDRTRVFIPECLVLHRCMNYSGCCGDSNHECVPKSMSIVSRAFLVVDRLPAEDEDYVMFHPKMATTISFVNHTECECREKPKLPKCTMTCPGPLRLTQEGGHCACDCFPNDLSWPCQSIKDGLTPLSQEELQCVRNGNCYIPRCSIGEFDINTGLCPLTDEYALPAFLFDDPSDQRSYREHLHGFDFSNPHGRIRAHPRETGISPTPSSVIGNLAANNGKQFTLESLASRNIPMESTTAQASRQILESFQESSMAAFHSLQNSQSTEDTSLETEEVSPIFEENRLNETELNSTYTPIHELHSSTSNSLDNIKNEDKSKEEHDALYSDQEFVSDDAAGILGTVEPETWSDSVKDDTEKSVHFATTAKLLFSDETVYSGKGVHSKDTHNKVVHGKDTHNKGVHSKGTSDKDKNTDDESIYFKDTGSKNVHSKDTGSKNVHSRDTGSKNVHSRDTGSKNVHSRDTGSGTKSKKSRPRDSATKLPPTDQTNVNKLSFEEPSSKDQTSVNKQSFKEPSSKDQARDRSVLSTSPTDGLKHNSLGSSHFHEHLQTVGTDQDGQNHGRDIHSDHSLVQDVSTASSLPSSFNSLTSAMLSSPKSSLPEISSSSISRVSSSLIKSSSSSSTTVRSLPLESSSTTLPTETPIDMSILGSSAKNFDSLPDGSGENPD